jgi:hypothetical protein
MPPPHSPKHENVFYLFAFILALALRLTLLGALPLSDAEARWALQALHLTQGTKPLIGSQTAYVTLTGLLFFLFGSSNFLARFWPALAGSALVFVPYLFHQRIKPRPALILAFFLAIDPGLVALSRQAGSPIFAVLFVLLTWSTWTQRRSRLAGVFGALALLSGPALWEGLLGLGLAWAIWQGMERKGADKQEVDEAEENESGLASVRLHWDGLRPALTSGIVTLLVGATLFFFSPNGLSAWLTALPEYLSGWGQLSGVSVGRLVFAMLAYEPLAIVLGLLAVVRGWWRGSRRLMRLSLWLLTALLLALFYPARQVYDLVWVALPLWTLASLELVRYIDFPVEERLETAGVVLLSLVILTFSWLDFAALANTPLPSPQGTTRAWLLAGALFLLALSILMVAVGWSLRAAEIGALWGVTLALGVYTLATAWGATGMRTPSGVELWQPGPIIDNAQANLLLTSVNDLSDWNQGHVEALSITEAGINSPALDWLMRDYDPQVEPLLDKAATPPLVITPHTEELGLPAAYRGQDFTWRQSPDWSLMGSGSWMQWLAFHKLPLDSETVILWARDDLFPDGESTNVAP